MYRVEDFSDSASKDIFMDVIPDEFLYDDDYVVSAAVDDDNNIPGLLCWSAVDNIVDIGFIVVDEGQRRNRIGSLLIDNLMRRIATSLVPYTVRVLYTDDNNQLELKAFIESMDYFTPVESGLIYRLTPEARKKSKSYQEILEITPTGELYKKASKDIKKSFHDTFPDQQDFGNNDGLDLSRILVENGRVIAAISAYRSYSDEIVIDQFIAPPNGTKHLWGLVAGIVADVEKEYTDNVIVVEAKAGELSRFTQNIFEENSTLNKIYTGIAYGTLF